MIASSSGEQKQGPAFKISDFLRRSKHLRYRTRVFAAEYVILAFLKFFHIFLLQAYSFLSMFDRRDITRN